MRIQLTLVTVFVVVIFQNCKTGTKGPDETFKNDNSSETTPVKMIDYITGTWSIHQVLRKNENITGESGITKNDKIKFTREGGYIRYSGTNKIDSGRYRVNERHERVYLSSENRGMDEEWDVSFLKDGMMAMETHTASSHGESITYIYQRIGNRDTLELVGDENI